MNTSQQGIELIKKFEGLHDGDLSMIGLQPKMCPAGYWTEGYGTLVLDNKGCRIKGIENKQKAYKFSRIHTVEQAEDCLKKDLQKFEHLVGMLLQGCKWFDESNTKSATDTTDIFLVTKSQCRFDALVSFCYNVGFENLKRSTLLKKIKVNPNDSSIATEFLRWNKSDGKILLGLTRRRQAESDSYFQKTN